MDIIIDMGLITEKPNRYPIFLKTDTEYRTDFYKNENRHRHKIPTPTHLYSASRVKNLKLVSMLLS